MDSKIYIQNKKYHNIAFNSRKLIVVILPTTKYYYENISKELIEELDNIIKYLSERFIKIVDLREYIDKFDGLDFIDVDHLSEKGSIKATNYLKQLI